MDNIDIIKEVFNNNVPPPHIAADIVECMKLARQDAQKHLYSLNEMGKSFRAGMDYKKNSTTSEEEPISFMEFIHKLEKSYQ